MPVEIRTGHPWARGADGGSEVVEQVRAIQRHGARATIQWKRDVYRGTVGTGCYETNRVSSVDEYGQVHYEENCTGEKAYTDDRTKKAVEVPWVEVAHVKPGELAHVIADDKTHKGHVVWVGAPRPKKDAYTTDTAPVQIREWRLAARGAAGDH